MKPAQRKAKDDRARGDLGGARRRLMALAHQGPYDAELCREIADLCVAMSDEQEAGRWYFAAGATDEATAKSREKFVRSQGSCGPQVLSALPRKVAVAVRSGAAPVVAEQVRALQGGQATLTRHLRKPVHRAKAKGEGWGVYGCLIVIMLVIALVVSFFLRNIW